jgi:hypothetical protein
MYFVKNRNTVAKIEEDQVYQKLQEEYKELIQRGAQVTGKAVQSNKVWICWLQGEENAPPIVKACINSVRRNLVNKEVVILSEETIPQYVHFPDHNMEKWRNKIISPAHFADLLRLALLCEYGGMWIDGTVLCTSPEIPRAISDAPLFVYQKIDLTRRGQDSIIASNWFISAWSQQPILLLTRDLLYAYWKNTNKIDNYFVFHIFFAMATRRYSEDWENVPVFNNQSPHTLQFELKRRYSESRWNDILAMSVFHKLNRYVSVENAADTFCGHIAKMYLEGDDA